MLKWIGSFLILFNLSNSVPAQNILYGKVYLTDSHEIIPDVNIRNRTSGQYAKSDQGGNFRIASTEGDIIIFSSAGYLPDTLILNYVDLSASINIYLRPNIQVLKDVEVDQMNKYIQDSIKRREDYAFILNKKHPVKFMNEKRPGDDPGFSFSPIGFFSKSEKRKRELKKRIKEEDEDEYIDVKFSESRVAFLTRLSGDSLRIFMFMYRPGYSFCRKSNSMDMFLYINDKFVLFKKQRSNKT